MSDLAGVVPTCEKCGRVTHEGRCRNLDCEDCWAKPTRRDPVSVLSRLRELADAATPGPWRTREASLHLADDVIFGHGGTYPEALTNVCNLDYGWRKEADGAFIIESRGAFPVLIAALEAVLDLHQPETHTQYNIPVFDEFDRSTRTYSRCKACHAELPWHQDNPLCPTVRVVSEHLSRLTTKETE